MSGTNGIRIGLDIGGTALKAVRIEPDDELSRQVTQQVGGRLDRSTLLDAIAATVHDLADGAPIAAIGIAVGGLVRRDGSMPVGGTNLPELADRPLAPLFGARLKMLPTVLNDAQAALHGEAWRGAARGFSDVLMMTLGTGIGGGLMLGGKVRRGAHGSAGEFGTWAHARGATFENFAAPVQFEQRTGRRLGDVIGAGGDDREAAQVLDAIGRNLAAAHTLLDLEVIVIGGSIAAVGEPLRSGIDQAIRCHCPALLLHNLQVVTSALGAYAGAIGAVAPTVLGAPS